MARNKARLFFTYTTTYLMSFYEDDMLPFLLGLPKLFIGQNSSAYVRSLTMWKFTKALAY
jgi:hypothetical protein